MANPNRYVYRRRCLALVTTIFVTTFSQRSGVNVAGLLQRHADLSSGPYGNQKQSLGVGLDLPRRRSSSLRAAADDGSQERLGQMLDQAYANTAESSEEIVPKVSLRDRLKQRISQLGNRGEQSEQRPSGGPINNITPDPNGIYAIKSEEEYSHLLQSNQDKLVVMKFTASYCRACAAMNPKFMIVKRKMEETYPDVIWADFRADPSNRAIFKRLGVLSLPTVHFYDSDGLEENFSCGPAKIPIFQQKLHTFLSKRLAPQESDSSRSSVLASAPRRVRDIRIGEELITTEHISFLQTELAFFKDLTVGEFNGLLTKARLESFLPGDVIIRQGMPGQSFYLIECGVVEMLIKSRFDDPISTPPSYLGAVVKELVKFDFFGERALTTGQPYAASVRVREKTRCFVFDVDDIPASSILSREREATQTMIARLTERYELPENYSSPNYRRAADESILELLVRFKQIRQAAKCFDYVVNVAKPLLGDAGEIARRSILVSKLSHSQRQDFIEVFQIADSDKTGTISLLEMKRFMESARRKLSDKELGEILSKTNPGVENVVAQSIGMNEFLGVMAEAEFYNLFTETFQELDKDGTGYVRAGDLDEVLHGLRDLVGYDRKSLIDVEDQDVQVDYEQFAKMLLGAAL